MVREQDMPESKPGAGAIDNDQRPLPSLEDISAQEIRDVLMDEGYSADNRRAWLREVLTSIQADDGPRSPEHARIVHDIKAALGDAHDDGKPLSDDVLGGEEAQK
jgi:hypothetical protein